ncbi:serine/threonine-protein kinase [Actinocorallia populi]|uniref:serine/threonine-protein kinase n=1 Tax=Actinocorallia populi TaxID=2079200 RepID=UPI00130022E6|nr:serine/threonine-protein kinase [Actinocorallia populi]
MSEPSTEPLGSGDPERLGDYRLLGRLGRGGMGIVYLGQAPDGGRVAVKVITPDLADDARFRDRFRREVDAARRVQRFCTAAVLDAELESPPLYVVTQYVPGPTLDQAVRDNGPLRDADLEGLAVGMATALSAIHAAGLVHRDLKPSNVLLSPLGPRVIDFGIARTVDGEGQITRTGAMIGTPAFLAPELLHQEPLTPAVDVFSWGCVVAFAANGRSPFEAPTLPEIIYRLSHGDPVLDGLEGRLRTIVEQSLSKNPQLRPTVPQLLAYLMGQPAVAPEQAAQRVETVWRQHAPSATFQGATHPPLTDPTMRPQPLQQPAASQHGQHQAPPPQQTPLPWMPQQQPAQPFQQPPPAQPQIPQQAQWPGPHTPGPSWQSPPTAPGGAPPAGSGGKALLYGAFIALGMVGVLLVALLVVPGSPLYVLGGEEKREEPAKSVPPAALHTIVGPEDFSDQSSGFPTDLEAAAYDNGRWRQNTPETSTTYWVWRNTLNDPDQDLLLSAKMQITEGNKAASAGFLCFGDDTEGDKNSNYELLVDRDGRARLAKTTTGTRTFLTRGTVPPLGEGEHHIQAVCSVEGQSTRLALWVDGEPAFDHTDTTSPYTGGRVGFVVQRDDGNWPATVAYFDDYHLTTFAPTQPSTETD